MKKTGTSGGATATGRERGQTPVDKGGRGCRARPKTAAARLHQAKLARFIARCAQAIAQADAIVEARAAARDPARHTASLRAALLDGAVTPPHPGGYTGANPQPDPS